MYWKSFLIAENDEMDESSHAKRHGFWDQPVMHSRPRNFFDRVCIRRSVAENMASLV